MDEPSHSRSHTLTLNSNGHVASPSIELSNKQSSFGIPRRQASHIRVPSNAHILSNNHSNNENRKSFKNNKDINNNNNNDVLSLAMKATIIALTISSWSLIILCVFIFVNDWNDWSIVFLMISIDSSINSVCIVLYWPFAKSFYRCLCCCFVRCGHKILRSQA